jgi:excisionase family DNA binding protein
MQRHDLILKKLDSIQALLKDSSDEVYTFEKTRLYLAVSASYLYKLTSQNQIPHSKPNGKKLYFSKNELDTWLKRNPVKTIEQMESFSSDYIVQKM